MACDFVVLLPPRHAERIDDVFGAVEAIDQVEARLTVYRQSSEISRLNRFAATGPQKVSPSTLELLGDAARWSRKTDGAFDITAGPLIRAWGFMDRKGRKPSPGEIEAALRCVGYRHVVIDEADDCVSFAEQGVQINLGAIGKGHAIDRLAKRLLDAGVDDFLIHGGQSSVLAHGNSSEGDDRGWLVGLAHPTKPQRRIAGLWLKNRAIGTSGSGNQFFHHRGQRYGHVIDPRTGYPGGDLLSLTVVCGTATDADACATALFVVGSAAAVELNHAWGRDDVRLAEDVGPPGAAPTPRTDADDPAGDGKYALVMTSATNRQDGVLLKTDGPIELVDIDLDLVKVQ